MAREPPGSLNSGHARPGDVAAPPEAPGSSSESGRASLPRGHCGHGIWMLPADMEEFEPWLVCVSRKSKTGASVTPSGLAVHLALGTLELSDDGAQRCLPSCLPPFFPELGLWKQ